MTALVAALAAFVAALDARADSARALPLLRAAAAGFDEAWQDPAERSAGLALNRSRAHFFAQDLPAALHALLEGLTCEPADRKLRQNLELLRDRVQYPDPRWRPPPANGLVYRVRRGDWYVLAAGGALAFAWGLARRRGRWIAGGLALFSSATAMAFTLAVPAAAVVRVPTPLRLGNAPAYPLVVASELPAGQEVSVTLRRGEWLRVQLPNGTPGWLPAETVRETKE
jgi:hypothetical protein